MSEEIEQLKTEIKDLDCKIELKKETLTLAERDLFMKKFKKFKKDQYYIEEKEDYKHLFKVKSKDWTFYTITGVRWIFNTEHFVCETIKLNFVSWMNCKLIDEKEAEKLIKEFNENFEAIING